MSAYVGPTGYLLELRDPEPKVSAPIERASTEGILMDGSVGVVQRAQRVPRTWELSWPYLDEADAAVLIGLEQGAYGAGPFWFYDPFAARTNMLPAHAAVPGLAGDTALLPVGATAVAGLVLPDGRPVASAATFTGTKTFGHSITPQLRTPVFPGEVYTASAHTDQAAGTALVGIAWTDAAGSLLDVDAGATVGTGENRPYVTAAAPAGAAGAGVYVTFSSGTGTATALQLNEGGMRDWFPGQGIPRVSINGLDQVYEALRGDTEQDRSFTVSLREVG